jgi:hypothetical protein
MACNESGRVLTWDTITFNIPDGLTAAQLKVTILDSNGAPIEGWTDVSPNAKGVLDMNSLTVESTGTKPTIQVNAGIVEEALLSQLTANVKFEAEDPQLCFDLNVLPSCPDFTPTAGDLSVPDGLIQSAAISTSSAGKTVAAGEADITLTGTNTETVCAASLARMALPDLEEPDTDTTGGTTDDKELADTGVRVNCVTPAAVKTPIFDQLTPEHIQFMLSKIPMGRFGTPDEIAAMVAWLCTEDCSFSTGAVFDLSGGRSTY